MNSIGLLLFVFLVQLSSAQIRYDPQTLYDAPGGLMDPTIFRSMDVTFYDRGYHTILE